MEEFPAFPSFKDAKTYSIKQHDLRDGAFARTSYAISVDETRYVLNGILFSFKDNKLTLVRHRWTPSGALRTATWSSRRATSAISSCRPRP